MTPLTRARDLFMRFALVLLPGTGAGAARPASPVAAPVLLRPVAVLGTEPLPPEALSMASLNLVGLRLAAPTQRIDVPQRAPFSVPLRLWLGDRLATVDELAQMVPAGATLVGSLRSEDGAFAQDLSGTLAEGLSVPQGLPAPGNYTLSGLRLVKDGVALFDADPASVALRCLGEVIISSVTSTPMTMAEIRKAGIQVGSGNYDAKAFTVVLSVGGKNLDLTIPVAIPKYNGLDSPVDDPPNVGRLELKGDAGEDFPDIHVAVTDVLPDASLTLSRPEVAHLMKYSFKGLVVIPGSIGYLHQFFKANLLVLNVLPDGSPYVVDHVKATLQLPPNQPLQAVASGGESADLTKDVLGASSLLKPGQTGSALWYLEGLKEGAHELRFGIQGEFSGGSLAAPIPITGEARGKVIIRNPTFDILLTHPDVVRKGEVYTLEARVTNTSQAIANGVTVSLDQAALGNVRIADGQASQVIDTLLPGQAASVSFHLRAQRNGEITGSYLFTQEGLSGGFRLTTGLGERAIKLNSDTLILPQTLEPSAAGDGRALPDYLREAMLRVMGQAHSIATAKPQDLPPGVLPIASLTIGETLRTTLNENGLFLKMGVDRARVWMDLWRAFTQSPDPGFDQLMRTTEAGRSLQQAFFQAWNGWVAADHSLASRLGDLGAYPSDLPLPAMAVVEGAGAGLEASIQGAAGLPGASSALGDERFLGLPLGPDGAQLLLKNTGATDLALHVSALAPAGGTLSLNRYDLNVLAGGAATLPLGLARAPQAKVLKPNGASTDVVPASTQDILPEAFKVLAVHRWDLELSPAASPFGTHVMVLFNRPNAVVDVPEGQAGFDKAQSMVSVEANQFWRKAMPPNDQGEVAPFPAALVQATPRIVSCYLEKPVGPNVPRALTLASAWTAQDGSPLAGNRTWTIASGRVPGGAIVRGHLRKPTGETLPGKLGYWYMVASEEGGLNLQTASSFMEPYYGLITNNVDTEVDGAYQLDWVPMPAKTALGPFMLQGDSAAGRVFAEASVIGPGQIIDMDLVSDGKGDVYGKVTDAGGQPVEGVAVQAYQEQPAYGKASGGASSVTVQTATAADGTYRIQDLKVGTFSLRFMKGLLGAGLSSEIPKDGAQVEQNLVLEGQTGSVKARVLNPDGSPRANQVVALGIPAGLLRSGPGVSFLYVLSADTDAQGYATFRDVPAGDVSVKVPNVAPPAPSWAGFLQPGASLSCTLQLTDPSTLGSVEIHVKDASGAPVPDAFVWWNQAGLAQPAPPQGHTDAAGLLVLPAPPNQQYSVTVRHPEWPSAGVASAFVTTLSGQTVSLDVALPGRAWVKGRVTDVHGAPVANAFVAIPPVYHVAFHNRSARTDAQGQYRIPGLVPGLGMKVVAMGPDLQTAVKKMVSGLADQEVQVDFVLPDAGRNTLFGKVFEPDFGTGVKKATSAYLEVWGTLPQLAFADWYSWSSPSNADNAWGEPGEVYTGSAFSSVDTGYRIPNLPAGTYRAQAWSDLFPQKIEVRGDFNGASELEQNFTLHSNFAASMEGQVTQPDGQAKPAAGEVTVTIEGGGIGQLSVDTIATGRYAFAKVLGYGGYRLRAENHRTGAICVGDFSLQQPTNFINNVRLWGRGKLTLHLLDSQGNPLSTGQVNLAHSKGSLLQPNDLPPMAEAIDPKQPGLMVFQDLWEGDVSAQVISSAGLVGAGSVTLPQGGGDRELTLRLQPVGSLTGKVLHADGSPASAGRVDLYQNGRWMGVSNINAGDGSFQFKNLPSGAVNLDAWDPDTRKVGHASAQIPDGATATVTITESDAGPVTLTVLQEGRPVERATVNVNGAAFSTQATTDAQGQASFTLPPGDYGVLATDPLTLSTGQLSFTRSLNEGLISLSLPVQPVRNLAVRALPPPGLSGDLSGWKVRSDSGRTATLGADGTATLFDLTVGQHLITLSDTQERFRGSRTLGLSADGGSSQGGDVQGLALGNVQALVQDDQGHPVAGGLVTLQPITGDSGLVLTLGTDAAGTALFSNYMQGTHGVSARDAAGQRGVWASVDIASEGQTVPVTLVLTPTAGFAGLLKDGAGNLVPFARVHYQSTAWGNPYGADLATDATGHFSASGVPLGTYVLSASAGSRSGSRTLTLATANAVEVADFHLNPAGNLRGQVVDPLRPSVPPVTVQVWDGYVLVGSAGVDAQGHYLVKDLPAAKPLGVTVLMDDGATQAFSGSATLPGEGAVVDFPITLEPRPNLVGQTYDTDGTTRRSMTLALYRNGLYGVYRGDATSADHPAYRMAYLDPKTSYTLVASDGGFELARIPVQVQAGPLDQVVDVRAKDLTSVRGRISRADARLSWPSGAQGRVGGVVVPLDPDGTLHLLEELRFDYVDQPLSVDVQVPGGPWWHVADVARVKNGFTQLALAAPAFGSAAISLLHKDGSPAAGASVTLDGVGSGTTDGSGLWIAPVVAAGTYPVRGASATEIGAGSLSLATDGQVATLAVPLDALLDISGTFNFGYAAYVRFYQQGAAVDGASWQNFHDLVPRTFAGSLDGRVLRGTWTGADGTHGRFAITFAPDASSFSGTWGLNDAETGNAWGGSRTGDISVSLRPDTAQLKPGATLAFTALVAGSPNKGIAWTVSGGTLTPDGLYTAPKTPGVYTVTAASTAAPAATATCTLTVSADGIADVSGSYVYGYAANIRIFQKGTQIEGDWWQNFNDFPARTFTGTLDGLRATGTWTDRAGGSGSFAFTFPIDASTFDAVWSTGSGPLGNGFRAYRTPGVSLRLKPTDVLLRTGEAMTFEVLVAGTYNKALTWSTTYGFVSSTGLFTAPSLPGSGTVTVASQADPTQVATARVAASQDGLLHMTGVWDSPPNAGLLLFQSGNAVLGYCRWADWNLDGTVDGLTVTGTWQSNADATKFGRFIYHVAPDGASFTGTWGNGSADSTYRWDGALHPGQADVFLRPMKPSLVEGRSLPFQGYVVGSDNAGLLWSATAGTVSADGLFTAPAQPGSLTVTVRAAADPSKTLSTPVAVLPDLTVSPATVTLAPGTRQKFTAQVFASSDQSVTWELPETGSGSIAPDGTYTAPASIPGQSAVFTVVARLKSDPTKTATAKALVVDLDPTPSLVGRWTFEEGAGSLVADVTGHGLNGTLRGGVSWIPGRLGQGKALSFDDPASVLEVPPDAQLNTPSLSLAFWAYLAQDPDCSAADNWRSLFHKGEMRNTVGGFDINLAENHALVWDAWNGPTDTWWPQGLLLPVGRWTHVVFTYDAATGTKQAFLDGVLKDTRQVAPAPLGFNDKPLVINWASASRCPDNTGGHFDGALDDIRIYSRALTPAEVLSIFVPVVLSPGEVALKPGAKVPFTASRQDGRPSTLTWGTDGGSIDASGLLTAPDQPGSYLVSASSSLDPANPGQARVRVRDFDAADEFSVAQNVSGAWSYGWSPSLGGAFTSFSTSGTNGQGVDYWIAPERAPALSVSHNGTPNVVPYWQGRFLPNQLNMHPGPGGEYSIVRWTAPEAGLYEVAAAFTGQDSQPTTTDVHVLLNGASRFDGNVNAYLQGPSYAGTLAVRAGDTVDFTVGFGNGNYYYDSTGLSVQISKARPRLSLSPVQPLLNPGSSLAFTATAVGLAEARVAWSIEEGAAGGSIAADGLYVAPTAPGIYHVVATSLSDPRVSAKTAVVVVANP